MKKLFTLLLLVCSLPLFSQTIYYVKPLDKGGNDANNGLSWATAFQTIQKALATITTGQIWVAAGTYYPDEGGGKSNNDREAYFSMRSGVALYGGFPATGSPVWTDRNWTAYATILSGDINKDQSLSGNAIHVVFSKEDNNTAILDGFTITGGNADKLLHPTGGGMRCDDSAPLIQNCLFSSNSAINYGAGMYNNNSDPMIINCRFYNNTAIVTNSAYGGAMYNTNGSSPTMINCLFISNHAAQGTAIYNHGSRPHIYNCTFTGNSFFGLSHYYGSAIYNTDGTYTEIINTILWGDEYDEINNERNSTGFVAYSIVQGGYSGTGNLNKDPLFVSGQHLRGCSPAINSGLPSVAPLFDYDRKPRPALGAYDMGAYEFQPGGPGTIIYVKQNASGLNNGTSWINAYSKLQDALIQAGSCYSPTQIWVAAGTYFPDEGTGLSNNDRSLSFALKNNTSIYGGFEGMETQLGQRSWNYNRTILSGFINPSAGMAGNSYHVVTANSVNNTATLDGFIIRDGNANAAGNNLGAGMYNVSSSPQVLHCSFENNTADQGGGMYNKAAAPTLMLCRFSNNSANFGGGVYNESNSAVLTSCSFLMNEAFTDGGGVYNYVASTKLNNCSFWNNKADAGGGVINFFSSAIKLTNCSFAGNTATVTGKGGGIYNWVSSPTVINSILWGNNEGQIKGDDAIVSYSIVQGGYSGTNNLTADPLFVGVDTGNLHLQDNSPAIDTGDNSAVSAIPLDGDGVSRIFNGRVDLGAFEWRQSTSPEEPGPTPPLTITCPGDYTLSIDSGICGAMADYFEDHPALVLGGARPVTITYTPVSGGLLPLGENLITVTATDGRGITESCSFTVTVIDTLPPVIYCAGIPGTTLLKPTNNDSCNYTIQGSEFDIQASDNCTLPLSRYYSFSGATVTEGLDSFSTLSGKVLNLGETTISFLVVDAAGNGAVCSLVVRVVDNTSPNISGLSANKQVLYPANHKMQDVTVNYNVTDNCSATANLSVTSNEPVFGTGSGDTGPDWEVIDNHHVRLRAERSGNGNGRIYTIMVRATDPSGNTSTATSVVTVPHDKAPVTVNQPAVDQEGVINELMLTVRPNPSSEGFNIITQSPSNQPLIIKVMDGTGKKIEQITGAVSNGTMYIGNNYRPGIYYIQVLQGNVVRIVKLVKQGR